MAPQEARLLEVRKPSTSAESSLALPLPIRFAKKKDHHSFWPFARDASVARDLTRPRWPFVQQRSPFEDVLTIGPTISVLVSEKTPEKIRFELKLEGARLRRVRQTLVDQVPCNRPPSRDLVQLEGTCLTIRGKQLHDRAGQLRNHWVRTIFFLDIESEDSSGARKKIATIPLAIQVMTHRHYEALAAASHQETSRAPEPSVPDRSVGERFRDLFTKIPVKMAIDRKRRVRFPETFDYRWLKRHWDYRSRSRYLQVSPMFWFKKQGDYVLFAFDLEQGCFQTTESSVSNPRCPGYGKAFRMLWAGSREGKQLHAGEDGAPVSLVMSGCDSEREGLMLWNEIDGGFYLPRVASLQIPVSPGGDDASMPSYIVDPTYVCDPPEEDPGG